MITHESTFPVHRYSFIEKLLFQRVRFTPSKLAQELNGKTILITGASSGIGEQVAYLLQDFPVHLVLVARRKENLMRIKYEIEKNMATVTIVAADLRVNDELEELICLIQELPHGLDIVVSNAGLSINRSIYESLDRHHDFERTMAINYFAPVKMLLAFIPLLEKNNGQIINISTINAVLVPFPRWAAYQASKTAFDSWLRSTAIELQRNGVSTTSIYLPLVKTDMIRPTEAYDRMPAMCPKHVAKIICKSMYTKCKMYRPWWLPIGQISSVLFRGTIEKVMMKTTGRGNRRAGS
ncbi:SDR family NAD(P)-dependent oxidoreductase [Sporosarcina sp. BI001-red]|uniref:SDR family NAD(P)-dependent oxidoreductase n=1 Tax=Sporosarcina sp. BI001-red TaxID=2282866 RepID=UPI000E22361D|nr:SDR family NAD(P)-dependent oxidoreductase [Sporosarcina sp. BI001-red]REB10153.1 SDR family NAD(P)-dependent oxidoreductase [Sporosarcina sp. BI001-red]